MQRRQTREQWIGIIEGWQGSGQSQREYCTKRGLVYSAFRYWFRTIKTGPVSKGLKAQVHAIEISRIGIPVHPMADQETTKLEITTRGIVIPIFGSDAAVTIVGRVCLDRLGQIITACEGSVDHARS